MVLSLLLQLMIILLKINFKLLGGIHIMKTFNEEVKKIKLPDGYEPFSAVAVGYKENSSVLTPSKRNREVVNYIR